jgi:hypothetical protein
MVGTPTSGQAVYYFADYEESKYQGRQRITRQHGNTSPYRKLYQHISHEDGKWEREKICSFFRFWKCNNNLPKIVLQNFVILFKNNTGFLLNLKNI